MNRSTPQDLARRYASGESIRDLAAATGASYATTRRRLVAQGVALRGPGRYPGLAGEDGAERYRQAVERGDIPATGTPPRAARGRRSVPDPDIRPRLPGPRSGRRLPARRPDRTAGETVNVERLRVQMLDALERCDERQRQVVVDAIPEHELWLAAEQLKAAIGDAFAPQRS